MIDYAWAGCILKVMPLYDAMFMASKLRPFALFVKMRPGPILAALKHSLWFSSARAAMHSLVKDFIRNRREDEEKVENLFIDSVLDCDFMDVEEVCLYLSFNFQFQSWSGVNTHINFISGTFTVMYSQRYIFSVSR